MLKKLTDRQHASTPRSDTPSGALVLSALGVVFGDIGTSPIYALRQAVVDAGSVNVQIVMGVLSTIVWAVVIVVMLKYGLYVMRADNEGEGGIIALTALVRSGYQKSRRHVPRSLLLAGLFGAAMFYGDSMITPAVSVLSAVEGLTEISPAFGPWVVPVAAAILIALFALQHRGSTAVGHLFGPVMGVWFVSLAAVGIYRIAQHPAVLKALSPQWAVSLAVARPGIAFTILGAVILALTGAEALYADIGHFGRKAIRIALVAIVFPSIIIGYFGQAATLLFVPGAVAQPFFRALPSWALIPGVLITVLATIIASQAVISGAFSMTSQAIELGFLPRMRIVETSKEQRGQVYSPAVNAILFVSVLFLVLVFRSSARLTSAYGIAVGLTMLVTTIQMASVTRNVWGWSASRAALVGVPLLIVDLTLVAANIPKIPGGGWFPVSVGLVLFVLMSTWNRGRELAASHAKRSEPLDAFLRDTLNSETPPARVRGTAVYPGNQVGMTPAALKSNVRHNGVMHETAIFFANVSESAPRIDEETRIETRDLGNGCYEIIARHGFVERMNLPKLLESLSGELGAWRYDPAHTTFFLPRDEVVKGCAKGEMMRWRERLFAMMSFHSASSAEYYGLKPEDVVELGVQIVL
ncbi:potassium transporter Kup [Paraburkholderia sabiae]|uniref:Probable potassium transport system protein Kup n=1 Tax=Paraburkholderia sabiae TaxID=273251 RepID=A0ABU9Q748_9BURK|nr:KUP/HAK/KT family potassium transporter [Paraburkholderia sabiae]WJZ78922.1 KUP/HAK/KT family potassium transporter [Paraburkholderia sabiae]CAD6513428.1 Low affinity potassium transport system protein kup [Paraburkholderia sabiae]